MTIKHRRAYLEAIRERYQNAPKKQKTIILDEFTQTCRYSRKYAIRILNGQVEPRRYKPGPKPTYGDAVVKHLVVLWEAMGEKCSKKIKAAMPLWLDFYKEADEELKKLLRSMSAATMDRLLKPYREQPERRRGLCGTISAVKSKIPIKLLDAEVKTPGYLEADTVAHCGDTIAGKYTHSVTMTDLYSGWTENRAIWTKEAEQVMGQIEGTEQHLPFEVLGFACDNGTEFLNDKLYQFWTHRIKPVDFVRRRPYKKNDNAHVEQKNFTHVRELFGYERLDMPEAVSLMNEIYRVYWNPLWNYFTPAMKLKSKTRVGAKIIKRYDEPKTPYQRLIDSDHLTTAQKKRLKETIRTKNPFFLKRELDKKLKQFHQMIDQHKKTTQVKE